MLAHFFVEGAFVVARRLDSRLAGKLESGLSLGLLRFDNRAVNGAAACFFAFADNISAFVAAAVAAVAVFVLGALLSRVFVAAGVAFLEGEGVAGLETPCLAAVGLVRGATLRRVLLLLLLLPFSDEGTSFVDFRPFWTSLLKTSSTTGAASPPVSTNAAPAVSSFGSGRVHFRMVRTGLKDLRWMGQGPCAWIAATWAATP